MMSTPPPTSEIPQPPPQALHYALANAQQVQIHQIGEDGQVQVVCTLLLVCFHEEIGGEGVAGIMMAKTSSPYISGSRG